MKNSSEGSLKPYALHMPPRVGDSSAPSALLDSAFYDDNRKWLIENLGIDVELVRNDPAFWLGMKVGTHLEKMHADNGTVC
jgi:hypothetical protein